MAAVVLIFTSQAWNLTFSFYQSMSTVPTELREAASIFRLDPWLRFKTLELPFAALGLIWNSMMSWAGGWFFLMAAEIFHVGTRDFRLPGLGAYLQVASEQGNLGAVAAGVLLGSQTHMLYEYPTKAYATTPAFWGAEPAYADSGPFKGIRLFQDEERAGPASRGRRLR